MQYRIIPAVAAPVILAIAGFTRPPALHAQAATASRPSTIATELGVLSQERAVRWAGATPVVHCAPAPLTERPGSAAELGRPHVAPLEEAFLDAAIVKRTFAARIGHLNRAAR